MILYKETILCQSKKVDTRNLSSREFNHTMTKLISDVGELTASSKYTKEALDELRVDVKKSMKLFSQSSTIQKTLYVLRVTLKNLMIGSRFWKIRLVTSQKGVFVKAAGYAGILFLGVILTKVFNVIEEIIK